MRRDCCPYPQQSFPPPKQSHQLTTHWFNKPARGRLTGTLFLDGSGLGGSSSFLRRAGWAVVQTDAAGNFISAAYGAAPWDAAPAQVARDGEDYAVAMLPEIAIQPFELYIDCAGTLSATRDPAIAQCPRHLRAHLWARVWASFRTLSSHKTKAHASKADAEQGLTTEWERKGNN